MIQYTWQQMWVAITMTVVIFAAVITAIICFYRYEKNEQDVKKAGLQKETAEKIVSLKFAELAKSLEVVIDSKKKGDKHA